MTGSYVVPIEMTDEQSNDQLELKFAYKVDARFQRFCTLFPLSGANLARVRSDKLSCLYLAYKLVGVASHAVVLNLCNLDFTLGVYYECTAIGQPFVFLIHTETAAQHSQGVGQHSVVDFLNAV